MDFLIFLKNNKLIILIVSILLNIILLICTSILLFKVINNKCECLDMPLLESKEEVTDKKEDDVLPSNEPKTYHVEIKGAVKTPGVYEVNGNNIINDVIVMAGGFKDDAYTDNINLSRHLDDELVIYVYTEKEYKKSNLVTQTSCNCETYDISNCTSAKSSIIVSGEDSTQNNNSTNSNNASSVSGKVNINTANINELLTLTGIGESKAKDIINYRENNGLFKKIEDIKKVNGIKDATYNKIKDDITV